MDSKEYITIVDFCNVKEADERWREWQESRDLTRLSDRDVRVDTGRGEDGDVRRYSIHKDRVGDVLSLLLTIEDTFQISGRGLLVVPGPLVETFPGPARVTAELRKPDGTVAQADLRIEHQFQTPPPDERRYACIFQELEKSDIPIGTEVWLSRDTCVNLLTSRHPCFLSQQTHNVCHEISFCGASFGRP